MSARDALAKRLRADGARDEAARVAKLRRPTPAAWALNQVARQRPELISSFLDAGAQLRAAMDAAVGGDASNLKTAEAAERGATSAVVDAAAGQLAGRGQVVGDPLRRRLGDTLHAAVVDEEVAALLREGVLDTDREAPGLGLLVSDSDRPEPGPSPGPGPGPAPVRRPVPASAPRPPARVSRIAPREAERRREQKIEEAGRREEARRLRDRAERLRAAAEEAEALAATARREAEEAAVAAAEAAQRLGDDRDN